MPYKRNLKISDLGEDYFIEEVTKNLISHKDVVIAAGDDCAVIKTGEKDSYQLLVQKYMIQLFAILHRFYPQFYHSVEPS